MDKLEGRIAYLPDGQKVRIEYVADGLATLIRLGGQWRGEIAVCRVKSLRIPDHRGVGVRTRSGSDGIIAQVES